MYKRKSDRGRWSEVAMAAAVMAVIRDKMPLFKASRIHAVPRSTLRDRVLSKRTKSAYQKESVLGLQNEKELVKRIIRLQEKGFGLSIKEVRGLAYEFAVKNKVPKSTMFNSSTQLAGWDWYRAFMHRNPELSVRTAESISYARAQCLNKPVMMSFFNMYEQVIADSNAIGKPQNIYNADESGLQMAVRAGKVLSKKGARSVVQTSNVERGETVTVLACCNASGNFVPPFVVFKGVRMKPEFCDNLPPGSIAAMSESGYINADLFLKWLKHFNSHRVPGKTVLIVDGHASHVKSLEVLDYAIENDIVMLCLPPHTTHFLQPLDRSFFRALKAYYDTACRAFVRNHPGRQIGKLQFGELLNEAWGRAASVSTAVGGFRATGLYPVNRASVPDYAFLPSAVSEIPVSETPVAVGQSEHTQSSSGATRELRADTTVMDDVPADSVPVQEPEFDVQQVACDVSFTDLQPSPHIDRLKRAGPSRVQKADVLTSPLYRKSLEEKLQETSKTKKFVAKESSTDVPKKVPGKVRQCKRSIAEKKSAYDNCVLCGEYGPGNELWYRCTSCAAWAHKACSAASSPEGYVCDFCT